MSTDASMTGIEQWTYAAAFAEKLRKAVHAEIGAHALKAIRNADDETGMLRLLGVALAAIVEAGTLVHAISPDVLAAGEWELGILDVLRGALRGKGHPVDEHGRNSAVDRLQ